MTILLCPFIILNSHTSSQIILYIIIRVQSRLQNISQPQIGRKNANGLSALNIGLTTFYIDWR